MNNLSYVQHNDTEIKGFFYDYRFLSNYHLCSIEYEGLVYPSSENAYMSAKSIDWRVKKLFQIIDPKEARKLGQIVDLRLDWESIKLNVMQSILDTKFKDSYLKSLLVATGDKYLEETNHWNDKFWGVCNGVGENNLGKILMSIRSKIK